MRGSYVLLVVVGLVLASGAAGAGDEDPPVSGISNAEAPQHFLEAFRAGDEATMRAIVRAPHVEAFLLAETLFFLHAEGTLARPPAPGDALAAAAALARCARDLPTGEGLTERVRAWTDMGPAALERRVRLGHAARAATVALARGAHEEVLRIVAGASADLHAVRRSIAAVYLLQLWGRSLMRLRRWDEGGGAFRTGVTAARRVGWRRAEGICLDHAGQCALRRADYRSARALHEKAVEVYRALGRTVDAVDAEANLARVLVRTGEPARARAMATKLRIHYANEGRRRQAAGMLEVLAEVAARLGDHRRAATLIERLAAELEAFGDRKNAALALAALGSALSNAGRHAEALRALDLAEALAQHAARAGWYARILTSRGVVHAQLGLLPEAQRFLEEALKACSRAPAPLEAARARTYLARVLFARGEYAEAAVLWEEQLEFWEQSGLVWEAADATQSLAIVCHLWGRLDEAEAAAAQALAVFRSTGHAESAAGSECLLARIAMDRAAFEQAERFAGRALADYRALGVTSRHEPAARRVMARVHLARGEPGRALDVLRRAAQIEATFVQGLGEHTGLGLRTSSRPTSDLGVRAALALARKDPARTEEALVAAYECSESGRGRLLAEQLANVEALLARRLPPDLLTADALTRSDVEAARGVLVRLLTARDTAPEQLQDARRALDEAWNKRREVVSRMQREARQVADLVYPEPAPLEEIRAQLELDTALLMFHFAGDTALALVITKDGGRICELGPSAEITDACRRYLDLVAAPGSPEAALASRLYAHLLAPLEEELRGRSRLIVCPDDVLAFLPWAALRFEHEGRSLRVVERWETVVIPSATVFLRLAKATRQGGRGEALLALGDPVYPSRPGTAGGRLFERLPGSGEEVRAIAKLFPPDHRTVLLQADASLAAVEAALTRETRRWRAVHLACHAYVDDEHPRRSMLVLAGGEMMDLDTVYRLRVPADLVVMSSCASARARIVRGEGPLGFVRGFFFSGAQRVVASNWKVPDDGTCTLMTRFYEGLEKEGLGPAAALRRAQRERLDAGGDAAHPHHWAAFTLWGAP